MKIYGLIHLLPLPGTPNYANDLKENIKRSVGSAKVLEAEGAKGCLVQTADGVYDTSGSADPARVSAISLIVNEVIGAVTGDFEVGVEIMRNAILPSLAVAKVCGAKFIRASPIVGQSFSDSGPITAKPLELLEYRRKIDAGDITIVADLHSMHFRNLDPSRSIEQLARGALNHGADAFAISDPDMETSLDLMARLKSVSSNAVFAAGGVSLGNVANFREVADAAFVGTAIQKSNWGSEICPDRLRQLVKAALRTS